MAFHCTQTDDLVHQSIAKQCNAINTELLFFRTKNDLTAYPTSTAVPHLWKYGDVSAVINNAESLLSKEQAERRVLMLINPALKAPFTTDTFYSGLQLVKPKEAAPMHRHTATAIRFIIESDGGFTSVDGQRFPIGRGDVVITPSWLWHHHDNQGEKSVLWLDSLDVPGFSYWPVHFAEKYEGDTFPIEDTNVSQFVFRWYQVRGILDRCDHLSWISHRYRKPNGEELSRTIGASAERIRATNHSLTRQETASSVYHVIEGAGFTLINDHEKILWQQGDTFCVPAWYKYQHFADEQAVYLYRVDDKPMLESLGFYRENAQERNLCESS